jgi:folylpolyglutamate synthase/dihydropteroate synthase
LSNGKLIALFPDPGQKIKVEADAANLIPSVRIDGSHNSEQAAKLIRSLHETKILLDSLNVLYEKTADDSVRNRLRQEFSDVLEIHRKFSKTFILTHYNSLASLYALYQQYQTGSYVFYKNTDLQFFKIVSDSLGKYIPNSRHVKALKAYTNNMLSDYNQICRAIP